MWQSSLACVQWWLRECLHSLSHGLWPARFRHGARSAVSLRLWTAVAAVNQTETHLRAGLKFCFGQPSYPYYPDWGNAVNRCSTRGPPPDARESALRNLFESINLA